MKVLIISHNPITTYHNMGKTFLSLFSSFSKDELCQLYIYPTRPDIDVCHSYFRVTDRDVLKSYFHFGKVHTKVLSANDIDTEQHRIFETEDDKAFLKKRKKNGLTLLGRDLMWQLSRWYNNDLQAWLAREKPTCIFLAPGESKFIYNIALKIARKLGIGIVSYICDEYYFVNRPTGLSNQLQLWLLQRKMKETLSKSHRIVTICDALADAYQKEFGTQTHTIHTGSNYPIAEKPVISSEIRGLTFMGNLGYKRYESLADIGRVLDRINREQGTSYRLFIYAAPLKEEVQQAFSGIASIEYCGYVTGSDFEQALHGADILLHAESFDPQCMDRVKNSVSTKIADSLGSGKLLFAYGPEGLASMQHLIRNRCAVVATGPNELQERLQGLLSGADYSSVIQTALATAAQHHSSETNSRRLHELIDGRR